MYICVIYIYIYRYTFIANQSWLYAMWLYLTVGVLAINRDGNFTNLWAANRSNLWERKQLILWLPLFRQNHFFNTDSFFLGLPRPRIRQNHVKLNMDLDIDFDGPGSQRKTRKKTSCR